MKRLSELQKQELESFGYIVRDDDELEKNFKKITKEQKPVSVKKPIKRADDVESKPDGTLEPLDPVDPLDPLAQDEDYSYLDELET